MSRATGFLLLVLLISAGAWILWPASSSEKLAVDPSPSTETEKQLEAAEFKNGERVKAPASPTGDAQEAGRTETALEQAKVQPVVAKADGPSRVIRGHVVVDGAGIAGAVVRAYSRDILWSREDFEKKEPFLEVDCDRSGGYTIKVSRTDFCLLPHADGFRAKDAFVVQGEAPAEIQDQTLELFPSQTLYGETLSDGTPLADVLVKVQLNDHWDRGRNGSEWGLSFEPIFQREMLSDAKGSFSILVPSSTYRVSARKDGYESPMRSDIKPEESPVVLSLRVKQEKGQYFHGIVLDPSGRPLAGARVVGAPKDKDSVSGPDGEFRLGPLKKSWGHSSFGVAWKEGFAPNFVELDFDQPDQLVEIQLLQAFRIEGQLLDAEGEPIANGNIRLVGDGNRTFANNSSNPPTLFRLIGAGKDGFDWLQTDRQGRFQFRHLPQGEYQLAYELSGGSHSQDPQPAAIAIAQTGDHNVILQVGKSQDLEVSFRGRVTDRATGVAIQAAEVDVNHVKYTSNSGWSASSIGAVETDENGYYEYLGLIEGTYYLDCEAGGYAQVKSEKLDYAAGVYEVDFALVEKRRVNLTVVDAKGIPVAGVEVEADNANGDQLMISTTPRSASSRVSADEKGKLTMFNMPAETVMIKLAKGWGFDLHAEKVDLSPAGPHQIEIKLPVAVHEDMQRIVIEFKDEQGASMHNISTDSDSALWVRSFDADGYMVDSARLWRDGDQWKQWKFDQPGNAVAGSVSIYLPKTGGRVEVDADGFQSRSLIILAQDDPNRQRRNTVDLVPN
jgi:hypothetical protein